MTRWRTRSVSIFGLLNHKSCPSRMARIRSSCLQNCESEITVESPRPRREYQDWWEDVGLMGSMWSTRGQMSIGNFKNYNAVMLRLECSDWDDSTWKADWIPIMMGHGRACPHERWTQAKLGAALAFGEFDPFVIGHSDDLQLWAW